MQVASDRRADKKHKRLKDTIKAMPYLLPAVISIIIFTIIPIVYTIVIAFTDYTMYSQGNIKFVGFANFIEVLTGPFKEVFLPVFWMEYNLCSSIYSRYIFLRINSCHGSK